MSNIPEGFCPCIVSKLHDNCIFIGVDNLPGSEIYLFSCVGGSNFISRQPSKWKLVLSIPLHHPDSSSNAGRKINKNKNIIKALTF